MANRYRVEHYSTVRAGEKVRTVTEGGHRVRIAFPPGRRQKGSGRVVEVLHPLHENPCRLPNPTELVVMMANPTREWGAATGRAEVRIGPGTVGRKLEIKHARRKLKEARASRNEGDISFWRTELANLRKANPSEAMQRKKETRDRAARIRGARLSNASGDIEEATRNYEEFHGRSSGHIDEYHEPTARPVTTSEVGDLIELQIKRPTGWKWAVFNFTGRNVKLARNVEGTQLYLVGGNQKVTRGELTYTGADNSKEQIDLGEAMTIAYRAKREMVDGIPSTYEHPFGQITGVRPRLMYDTRGAQPRLFLVGGEYRVTERGIEN